jgi:hypothetical protein
MIASKKSRLSALGMLWIEWHEEGFLARYALEVVQNSRNLKTSTAARECLRHIAETRTATCHG